MISLLIFFNFMKYGVLCFGGGYMIIPLLYSAYVEETALLTPDEYGNLLSISQLTPGAVSINTATYVGYLQDNILGAISASLGLCLPTLILAITALNFFNKYQENIIIKGTLQGARWAAFVMICFAVCFFSNISVFAKPVSPTELFDLLKDFSFPEINLTEFGVMSAAIILSWCRFSVMWLILLSGAVGWVVDFL